VFKCTNNTWVTLVIHLFYNGLTCVVLRLAVLGMLHYHGSDAYLCVMRSESCHDACWTVYWPCNSAARSHVPWSSGSRYHHHGRQDSKHLR